MRIGLVIASLCASGLALAEDDIKVSQQMLPDSDVPINIAEGVIDAPAAEVWAIVSQCGNYAKTMSRVVKSTELSRSGDEASLWTVKCEVTVHLPFPLSDLTGITNATHKVQAGVKYSREWTLVSGDYHLNQGSWSVVAIDEGKKTLLTYKLRVKPRTNLPTAWIVGAQKSALKDVIRKMREVVKRPTP